MPLAYVYTIFQQLLNVVNPSPHVIDFILSIVTRAEEQHFAHATFAVLGSI
jgi:hypothetical protein